MVIVDDRRRVARHRVRHFGAHFAALDEQFGDVYPRMFVRGEGVHLVDDTGHRVLDAGNHLGVCVVGHGRQDMAAAIAEQVRTLEFSSFEAGASHVYAAELAERLAARVPVDDPVLSFVASGSEANEVAVKIARDYHRRMGSPDRFKIMSRHGSYHGSTYAGTTATQIPAFRDPFGPLLPGFVPLPQPFAGYCGRCGFGETCGEHCVDDTIAAIEAEGPETIAAIIAEPISIPGAVKIPPESYWAELRAVCDRYGILLIADEVVTGFGRTGHYFACERWQVRPDILTMAKGMTSGYVPMGAAAVSRKVDDAFAASPLVHVNTYAGHPVGCAAALATMRIIDDERLVQNAAAADPVLRAGLDDIAVGVKVPARASSCGLLGSLELVVPDEVDAERVRASLWHRSYEAGTVVRVTRAGQVVSVFFYPPLTIAEDQLKGAISTLGETVRDVVAESVGGV